MLIHLDFDSEVPIYRQIRDQIVRGIAEGTLQPGERLPSVRALADEAGINMMTVSKSYQLLKQEGYITLGRRSGAAVAQAQPKTLAEKTMADLARVVSEVRAAGWSEEEFADLCRRVFQGEAER
ncbi:MAG: GntR family transcriptional regulator [Clostridia bacterium]|nr:GntR family transcriptional regulator [Clostridia bacterium]